MKTLKFLFIAATVVSLTSCGGSEDEKVESTNYSLDTENSQLNWKGSKSAEYFHVGNVKFSEGSIVMEGDKLVSGTFTIDMSTIKADDATLSDDKKEYLASHLKDTAFFFVAEHPKVIVTVNGYKNGELETVINVLGQDIKQNIPVKITHEGDKVMIKGKFDIDFSALKMEGLQTDPETGEGIQPTISYDLDLTLNKK